MSTTAIILSAGSGRRMGGDVKKQYILLKGKPVIYYTLKTFEESFIDNIVLVTGSSDVDYCRKEIVEKYGFKKVTHIVAGGKERYHSVMCGLQCVADSDYVFVHDGARPFVGINELEKAYDCVKESKAVVIGVPSKDTVKIIDACGNVCSTPRRDTVYIVQTPQVFETSLLKQAYEKLKEEESELEAKEISITDDAMVVEYFTDVKIKVSEGSYSNIKITTPEDLLWAENLIK